MDLPQFHVDAQWFRFGSLWLSLHHDVASWSSIAPHRVSSLFLIQLPVDHRPFFSVCCISLHHYEATRISNDPQWFRFDTRWLPRRTTTLLNGSTIALHCSSSRCIASLYQLPVFHRSFLYIRSTPLHHHEPTRFLHCCSMVPLRSRLLLRCTTSRLHASTMALHYSSSRCIGHPCQAVA